MNPRLKVTKKGEILKNGKSLSHHELEMIFLENWDFSAKLFIDLLSTMAVKKFGETHIDGYSTNNSASISNMLHKTAFTYILDNIRFLYEDEDDSKETVLTQLLAAYNNHPKS